MSDSKDPRRPVLSQERDEVLKRMLKMKPKPHAPATKPTAKKSIKVKAARTKD